METYYSFFQFGLGGQGVGRGFVRFLTLMLKQRAEFRNDVRIHDVHGPDQTQAGHGLARCESEEDRKGDQEGGGYGVVAERA